MPSKQHSSVSFGLLGSGTGPVPHVFQRQLFKVSSKLPWQGAADPCWYCWPDVSQTVPEGTNTALTKSHEGFSVLSSRFIGPRGVKGLRTRIRAEHQVLHGTG